MGHTHDLPIRLTSFVGRAAELSSISDLLDRERLITLTGAGGCGKTRLALQVAADRVDSHLEGMWWVDLSRVADGELVVEAIASALNIKEMPGRPLSPQLIDELQGEHLLLLDNCEHLIEACASITLELVRSNPDLKIVATSREPLGVEGEVVWRVPSMKLPAAGESNDELAASESVRLFADRASRVDPTFVLAGENLATVGEICRRLDGMPLAIELAAARIRMMTPQQIADGLEDRFRLLTSSTRTALPRHRALRASVDWSHDLLSNEERVALRRLAVFVGGFSLDAAEAVCSGDPIEPESMLELVSGLVDRSLIQIDGAGRYRLLETIRQYALDRLIRSGEHDATQDRHVEYFVGLVERALPEMEAAGLLDWLPILDAEHDNLRTALAWSERSRATDHLLRLVGGLWFYWQLRGHLTEGRRRAEVALGAEAGDPRLRANALLGAASLETYHGDLPATSRFAKEALAIARELEDQQLEARALATLAYASAFLDPPAAPAMFERSIELSRSAGDVYVLADAHDGLGIARFLAGDLPRAREAFETSLVSSEHPSTSMIALGVLGYVDALQGRLQEAEVHARDALRVARELRDGVFIAQGLFTLGFVEALRGRPEEAESLLNESIETVHEASPLMLVFALLTRAFGLWIRGDIAASASIAERTRQLARELGMPWPTAWSLAFLAHAARMMGDLETARRHLAEAFEIESSVGMRTDVSLDAQARLARADGDPRHAEALHHEALGAAKASESVLLVPMQLEALAGLASLGGSHAEAGRLFGAADTARATFGLVRFAVEEEDYLADLARSRDASEQEFRRAWDEGSDLSLEDVLSYASRGRGPRSRPTSGWASLTPTEIEVVRHAAEGLTNPQIAERLFVSRSTVKVHLAHIFAKLGVSTRAELAAAASKRDL